MSASSADGFARPRAFTDVESLGHALQEARLELGAIDVWTVRTFETDVVDQCRACLSPGEAAAASRFRLERDRLNSIVSRGFRRLMIARYTRRDPRELRFDQGPQGKPFAVDSTALRFNVTHSGDVVMLAACWGSEVGLDVEQIAADRTAPDLDEIAQQAFSERERRDIASLPPPRRELAFYRCWTEKEAFIKLVGAGLHFPLDAFDVEVDPSKAPALLGLRAAAPNALPCAMASLPAPQGYVATIAVRGAAVGIRMYSNGGR